MKEYKTCSKCRQILPYESFGKDGSKKDGLKNYCRDCYNGIARASYVNRASYWPEYRARNEQKIKSNGKIYRAKNKDQLAINRKLYYQENSEKLLAKGKRHREENPLLYRHYSHDRRANIKSRQFLITKKQLIRIMSNNCFYCGSKSEHLDHVLPLARGGNHSIGNLVASCAHCNTSKGAKTIMEWKLWKRRLDSDA
jgi:5-methylcytosine-specific restriction endonuclease McrA